MKKARCLFLGAVVFCFMALQISPAAAATAGYDFSKMPDVSDFDPNNPIEPKGDTIKIAIVASFSGPAAEVGEIYYISVLWAAHDINKRGGLMVDGKKKMVKVFKADHQSKPDVAKKISERMVLQEKVDVLWGTNGSHLMKVINDVAGKYKKIAVNSAALSGELQEPPNFTRYAFMPSVTTEMLGQAGAYYYGQMRKQEKKFYILCQDYLFGHSMAAGFKEGLKKYYPEAEIVGEDYHKLFLTDFAPYLEKIKASGAEVIYTGDWIPDAANLLKQARQMGIKLPLLNKFVDEPNFLHEVGVEGTEGLVNISQYGVQNPAFKNDQQIAYYKRWNDLWQNKWTAPYNKVLYKHPNGEIGAYIGHTLWALSVIERAGSTNPDKIIEVWEGDSYEMPNGKVLTMRACDHKAVGSLHVHPFVRPELQKESMNIPPYYWFEGASNVGPVFEIPADKCMPNAHPELCK